MEADNIMEMTVRAADSMYPCIRGLTLLFSGIRILVAPVICCKVIARSYISGNREQVRGAFVQT